MKSLAVKSLVVVIAIASAVAGVAYASAQDSDRTSAVSRLGIEPPLLRSARANEVEGEITRTDLGGRMEDSLGDAFAGVWFEPTTAQLNVGIVSSASAQLAEAAVAEMGLSELVTEVPVTSTWSALEAVQERWDRSLVDLLQQGKVATSLVAHRNAVTVELGSSVSAARRAALERAAATDRVQVVVETVPYSRLSAGPVVKQCEGFKTEASLCDPTIVGGVTIRGPWVKPVSKGGEEEEEEEVELEAEPGQVEETEIEEGVPTIRNQCTAGPAVIKQKQKPVDKAEATKTYILTAGHCIDEKEDGGGKDGKWTAYNKMGISKGANELGPAIAYLHDEADVGVIEVKPGYWAKANDAKPVKPGIAPLDPTEFDPLPVIDIRSPVEKMNSCMSGQISGRKCGEIVGLNKTMKTGKITTKGLFEVKGVTPAEGDSGAPMYAEAEYKKGKAYVEGIAVGRGQKTKNLLAHSLEDAFLKLRIEKGLKLELLTIDEEIRHPTVTADKYPVTVSAEDATSEDKFTMFDESVECTERELHAELSEEKQLEDPAVLELTPTYSGCTMSGGLPVVFTDNECKYRYTLDEKVAADHYRADLDVVCPEGEPGFEFDVYEDHPSLTSGIPDCVATIPPQTELGSVTLTNSGDDIVIDAGTAAGIEADSEPDICLCTNWINEITGGIYHYDAMTLSGTSGGAGVKLDVGGGQES